MNPDQHTPAPLATESPYGAALGVAFIGGLYANIVQVALIRFLLGTFSGTEIHLGIFLAVWLLGISLGAAAGMLALPHPSWLLVALAAHPWLVVSGMPALLATFPIVQGGIFSLGSLIVITLIVLFPAAFLLGWLFPTLIAYGRSVLGPLYAIEALGSFAAGLLLSMVLAGRAPPALTLIALPCLALTALALLHHRQRLVHALLILAPPLIAIFAPTLTHHFDQRIWGLFHSGQTLVQTFETPYQSVAVGKYEGQYSLFADGALAAAWPDQVRAEEKVHTFVSGIADPHRLLLIGCPTPDVLAEFAKYPLHLDVVDLDSDLMSFLASAADYRPSHASASIAFHAGDPRRFVTSRPLSYNGILLLSADPVSLSANRLFTVDAMKEYAAALATGGLFSFSLTGTENYLGEEMEQSLLSTYQTARSAFPEIFVLPGDPITFWCAHSAAALATDPAALAARFTSRSLTTVSFSALSFRNLLLPWRVQELQHWLQRSVPAAQNTDLLPSAFPQQLRLWNVYSASGLGTLLSRAASLTFAHCVWLLIAVLLMIAGVQKLAARSIARTVTVHTSAGTTGATGILVELALIFLYQVRCGALFHLLALFFGLYMLGLAAGARLELSDRGFRRKRLLFSKAVQLSAIGIGFLAIAGPVAAVGWCTSASIFLFSLAAGFELSLLDRLQRGHGMTSGRSAASLMVSDNGSAVLAALVSGPILLPAIGISGVLLLASVAIFGNMLLVLSGLKTDD